MENTKERLIAEGRQFITLAGSTGNLEVVRERLFRRVSRYQFDVFDERHEPSVKSIVRVRDCSRAMRSILRAQSDRMAGFSVSQALFDIAHGKDRLDLEPGFYAELIHIIMGMQGRGPGTAPAEVDDYPDVTGREAARIRSRELDKLWSRVEKTMNRYETGMVANAIKRRKKRREKICSVLGASESDWQDWRWHVKHVAKDLELLQKLVPLSKEEKSNIEGALKARLPFGVTPYYLSLMDANKRAGDRCIRAQVFPPANYVETMAANRGRKECAFDFMLEHDTSPIDLITRRYPGIVILKPFNTCPQICVYCQRNWEIDSVMAPNALAGSKKLENAAKWIAKHPAVHEVLITGGDPLALNDRTVDKIIGMTAAIKTVRHIRIGSRLPVTIPFRITDRLIKIIAGYIKPGRRDISLVTHVEHPYEVTPDMAAAVRKFREAGIPVYNQQVFTFFNSRRFETALLRMVLRQIGVEPYYLFNTKGKSETRDYIVPIARLLQEINEEARLLPGLTRTDEAVYNVPGLGKNYLRARHHRDLVSILPNGSRVYEFHPWDRGLASRKNFIGTDAPVLTYLERMKAIGENIDEYQTIWYYY